jgi:DNA-binding NarL/FixJ family response regulator
VPSDEAESLSDREQEILKLVAAGNTNRQIGEFLFLSENTVKYHLKNILGKLHLHNRAEAVAYAMGTGLIQSAGVC